MTYGGRIETWRDLLTFQKRRFWRLYPLHLTMLLVFLAFECLGYIAIELIGGGFVNSAFTENNAASFAQNLLLIQNLVNPVLTWNHPAWSISAEFYTYMLFAILYVTCRSVPRLRYVAVAAIIAVSAAKVAVYGMESTDLGIYRCLLSFFIGSLLFDLEARLAPARLPAAFGIAATAATILFVGYADQFGRWLFLVFPILCAATIFTLNASDPAGPLRRALTLRALTFLGRISFGIYMIHAAVWWLFDKALIFVFLMPLGRTETGRVRVAFDSILTASAVHLLGLALIIWLARISHDRLEAPLSRRFR